MVRTSESLGNSLKALAEREEAFARVLNAHGHPEPRHSPPGVETLLRTIVGQQVSVAAARSMFQRAAEGCDKDAALALASSYDPNVLRKLGIAPVAANVATARSWYDFARQLGSQQAGQQLQSLGDGGR